MIYHKIKYGTKYGIKHASGYGFKYMIAYGIEYGINNVVTWSGSQGLRYADEYWSAPRDDYDTMKTIKEQSHIWHPIRVRLMDHAWSRVQDHVRARVFNNVLIRPTQRLRYDEND